jgi:hypothetical protein
MSDLFRKLVDENFGFVIRDYGFVLKDEHSTDDDAPPAVPCSRRLVLESATIQLILGWHQYDELSMSVWVLADTFWIRPADPRSFDFLKLVRLVAPSEVAAGPSLLDVDFTEDALRPRLEWLASLLRAYGVALLRGDLSLCEDVLIKDALQET